MSKLKPLQPNPYGTNRWNFSGKALPPEEIKTLYDRGLTDYDWMPDGRLKHPKFRRNRIKTSVMSPSLSEEEISELQEKRWIEYEKIPAPKPDFFEWASFRDRRQLYDELERIVSNARRASEKLKALSIILEFSKSRPKTQIEVDTAGADDHIDAERLLEITCDYFGVKPEDFRELVSKKAS